MLYNRSSSSRQDLRKIPTFFKLRYGVRYTPPPVIPANNNRRGLKSKASRFEFQINRQFRSKNVGFGVSRSVPAVRGDERGVRRLRLPAVVHLRQPKERSFRLGDRVAGEAGGGEGAVGGGAGESAEGEREGADDGKRVRGVLGRDRER